MAFPGPYKRVRESFLVPEMSPLLFALLAVAAAAPTASSSGKQACKDQTIALKDTFTLPLTPLADNQHCTLKFTVPKGYFADVQFHAFNVQIQNMESADIMDEFGDIANIGFGNVVNSTLAWPTDFVIVIQSGDNTQIEYKASITLVPAKPQDKIVKSYVTFAGVASSFLYSNEWVEGTSYKYTSKASQIYVNAAHLTSLNGNADWNNVFVYDNGVLVGTLNHVINSQRFISESNNILLYCAKKIDVIGAAMITDYTNIEKLTHIRMEYLPTSGNQNYPLMLSGTDDQESAVTVVSTHDGSNPLSVASLQTLSGNGTFSYISGGPIQVHTNAKPLDSSKLPETISGYATTFYLANGSGFVGVKRANN